jgi:hypothetical protein
LSSGIALLIYGLFCHTVTVEVEKERQISIAVPLPPEMSPLGNLSPPNGFGSPEDANPFGGSSGNGDEGNPFEPSSMLPNPPGMKMEKVTEKYMEGLVVPELAIVEDVTVGGVVRLANGTLKRTYSGKAPSLCPS